MGEEPATWEYQSRLSLGVVGLRPERHGRDVRPSLRIVEFFVCERCTASIQALPSLGTGRLNNACNSAFSDAAPTSKLQYDRIYK